MFALAANEREKQCGISYTPPISGGYKGSSKIVGTRLVNNFLFVSTLVFHLQIGNFFPQQTSIGWLWLISIGQGLQERNNLIHL